MKLDKIIVITAVVFAPLFSTAAQGKNGWNLKLTNQPGLTKAMVQSRIQPFYDERDVDNNLDGIEERPIKRNINSPHFFQTPKGVYAIVVVQNIARQEPRISGWCDVFLFGRKNSKWLLTGRKLMAGGGGTNGYAGEFKELLRTGQNSVGVVIKGGGSIMGHALASDDIIKIENGKLLPGSLVSISTYIDNGGDDANPRCEKNTYKFIPSQKKNYDLHLITTDCTDTKKHRKTASVTVVYINGRYKIPDNFRFEL